MFLFKKSKKNDSVLQSLSKKGKLRKYFFFIVGCMFSAISFNVFFAPNNLVIGGISGISIIVKNIFGIDSSVFLAITYTILIIISYVVLGKETTKHSLIGSICYPLFVFLTKNIVTYIHFDVNNMLLIALFGAFLNGLGSGLTFKGGFSTGGTDVVCQIISKYFKITIGDAIKIVNIVIIVGAGFFLGKNGCIYAWENVMYAIIAIYIVSLLNNKLLLQISESKAFYIITDHETNIKNFLINELGRGVTVLEGRGGYTGDRKKVILCVIPTREYFLAKEGILGIDKNAILLINDVYQSSGIE